MKVGVIGLGYWGPNLVRNFLAHSDVTKVIACDAREDRLKFIKGKFPAVELANGGKSWFLNDKTLTEQNWKVKMRQIKLTRMGF